MLLFLSASINLHSYNLKINIIIWGFPNTVAKVDFSKPKCVSFVHNI